MFNHIHQHESSVSRTKPGINFTHFSGIQMVLLGYEETASLADGLYPSNSAGQTTHHLETQPYQAPVLGICLWLVQIISGVQGPTQIRDEEGGKNLWKKRTPEKPLCSESNKGLLIQAKRAARFEFPELPRGLGQANALPLQEWQGGNHIKTLPDKNKLLWFCLGFLILHTPLLMTGQGSEHLNPLSKYTHLMQLFLVVY